MRSSPLFRTATLVAAGVLGLLLLAAFAVALRSSQHNGRKTVEERFADGSKAAAALVSSVVEQSQSSNGELGPRLLGGRSISEADLRKAVGPGGGAIVVLDAQGRRIAAYPPAAKQAPITGPQIDQALAGQPSLSGALRTPQGAVIEVVVPYSTPSGRRLLIRPSPVSAVQKVLGPYLSNLPGLSSHRAYIVDLQGHVLADSEPKAPRDHALDRALPSAGRLANRSYAGGERQLSVAPVAGSPWNIVDTVKTSVLYSPVNGWQRALPWIFLLLLVPAGAFILLLALRARRAAAQAHQASEAKSAFLSSMSHELRTPMTTVIGFSEMLHDGKLGALTERQHEVIRHIVTSSRHLNQLVGEILDLSRVEEGRMTFHPTDVLPHELVSEVVDGMSGLAEDRAVTIEADAPNIGTFLLDPARFKQVVYNLLGNAIKFSEAGDRVIVRLALADHGELALTVTDHGPGIHADDLDRIFLPFEQGSHRNGGAGLGLAVSRRIADAQGGAIDVDSTPGEGATFTFRLPGRT